MNEFLIWIPNNPKQPIKFYPDADSDRREELEEMAKEDKGRLLKLGEEAAEHLKAFGLFEWESGDYSEVARDY